MPTDAEYGCSLGIAETLLIIFIVLKLTGLIAWSWWWVLSPLWIVLGLWILIWLLLWIFSK